MRLRSLFLHTAFCLWEPKQCANKVNVNKPSLLYTIYRGLSSNGLQISFSSHSRAVAVLIHKSIPLQVKDIYADPGGRYVIIQDALLGE